MAFSDLTKKQKGLPNDEILAGLYALSRVIKSRETSYVESKPQFEDVEDFHQKIYGETKLVANPFFMNAYAQLSFITSGCKLGQCSFCTYGANKCELTPEDVRVGMTAFLERFEMYEEQTGKKVYSVLFDAVGSILDSREFSPECLDVLFECLDEFLAKKDYIEEIGFETHYQTLGSLDENGNYNASYALQKLIEFKRKYADKKAFVIELGFESANPEIRNNIVFKPIDTNICKEAIDLLHQNGISVDLNVMATLPFLTKKEQIQSSAESLIEALTSQSEGGYGADNVVFFPLNIRENSFCAHVMDLYADEEKNNPDFKKPVWINESYPIWSLVASLNALIESGHGDLLEKVSVAWFGNRAIEETDVFPKDYEDTYPFFVEYRKNKEKRVEIIKKLTQHPKYKAFIQEAFSEEQPDLSVKERMEEVYAFLDKNSPIVHPEKLKTNGPQG